MKYVEGDLFDGIAPFICKKTVLIPHLTNNVRVWKSNFALRLGRKHPEAVAAFFRKKDNQLGITQFVQDENLPVIICNMFAQDDIKSSEDSICVNYKYLRLCMDQVAGRVYGLRQQGVEPVIACPKFGCDVGGDWNIIEKMILEVWSDLEVVVYFPKSSDSENRNSA